MAQLWGGRFTKQQDDLVKKFNDSLPYDRRLYRQDIRGSIVHATMLGKQGMTLKTAGSHSRMLMRIFTASWRQT